MNQFSLGFGNGRRGFPFLLAALLLTLLCPSPGCAKVATDFNPDFDFQKFTTFAFIGGVERLLRMQLNPDLLRNRIYRTVARELISKGLRQVQLDENPDLAVRYWVETESDAQVAGDLNWGVYGPFNGSYWGAIYTTMATHTTHKGTIGIELIDAKTRDLAWRLFVSEKINHSDPDKIWKKADSGIKKAFQSYPPSAKAIKEKKLQWAKANAQEPS